MVCAGLAVVALAVLAGLDLRQHLAQGGAPSDNFKRVFYRIVTATDFPMVAILVGSIVNLCCCSFRAGKISEVSQAAVHEDTILGSS